MRTRTPSLLGTLRHPGAVALRLLLWPTVILLVSHLVAGAYDDALAGGLAAFGALVLGAGLLATADGCVLRLLPLALVWSVTTVVVAGLSAAEPLSHAFETGPGRTTWDYAVQSTLADLPLSLPLFLVLVGVPVVVGALAGQLLGRLAALRPTRTADSARAAGGGDRARRQP